MAGQNKAAARALRILSLFASETPSFSTAELSTALGLTRNSVFRCLETLTHLGYLARDSTGTRYELGAGIVQLRSPRWETPEIRAICRPIMERLAEMTGQSVHLLLHAGSQAVVVESIQGFADAFRLAIGTTLPLHVSPGARCILAALSDAEVEAYIADHLPLAGFTARTITNPRRLRSDVRQVRAKGWALSNEDFVMGRVGIAFPVFDRDGRPHGSVVVAGSTRRTTPAALLAMLPRFTDAMAELNRFSRLYRAREPSSVFDA